MPNAQPKVDFNAKQREFAAYIRDPNHNPAPADVSTSRMAMYRELFFNNINGFLASNFPVLRAILDDQQWFELAQDFFANHACQSPYFSDIPEEFLAYLQHERNNPADLPFMLELAHYEWVEMALAIAKEDSVITAPQSEPLLTDTIQLSPLAWALVYQYPVHKLSPAFLPRVAPEQPSCLIVYRDSADDVHFIEITPMTYQLLAIIQEHGQITIQQCLQRVAEAANYAQPDLIMAGGLQIIKDLVAKSIIMQVD